MGLFDSEITVLEDYIRDVATKLAKEQKIIDGAKLPDIVFAVKLLEALRNDFDKNSIAALIFELEQIQIKSTSTITNLFKQKPVIGDLLRQAGKPLFGDTHKDIATTFKDIKPQMISAVLADSFIELLKKLQQNLFKKYEENAIFKKRTYAIPGETDQSGLHNELESLLLNPSTRSAIGDYQRNISINGHSTSGKSDDQVQQVIIEFTKPHKSIEEFLLKNGQVLFMTVIHELNKTTILSKNSDKVELNQYKGNITWSKDSETTGGFIGEIKLFCTTAAINGRTYTLDTNNQLTEITSENDGILNAIKRANYTNINQQAQSRPTLQTETHTIPIVASANLKIKLTDENGGVKIIILGFETFIYTDELAHMLTTAPTPAANTAPFAQI